ncbi:hypothetical protein B0J14DRAFT_668023 [Halenospora varia]|nr:hypothetical protein B0J14DRAFT_668023 [Halenospora varia]
MASNDILHNHACPNRRLTTNVCHHRRPVHDSGLIPQHLHQEDCPNYNKPTYDKHNHLTRISEQPAAGQDNLIIALPPAHTFSAGQAPFPTAGQCNTIVTTNSKFCQVHGVMSTQPWQPVDGALVGHTHDTTIPTNPVSGQLYGGVIGQQEQSVATDYSMNSTTPIDNLAGLPYQDEGEDDNEPLFPISFGAYSAPGSTPREDMVIALSKEDRKRPLFYVETHSALSASPSIFLRSSTNYAELGTADLPFFSRKTHLEAFGKQGHYSIIMQKGNIFSRRSKLKIPIETRGTTEEFEWKGIGGGELTQTATGRVVETETLHAQDTEYFTGTDGFHIRLDGEWYLGTRGKKWRTVTDYSSKLMELIIKPDGNLKRLAKGEAALVFEYPEIPDMLSTRIAAEAQRCIANWDWKTGLEDQWEKWKAFKRGYNDDILDIMIGWIAEVKALKSRKEQEEFDTEDVRAVASSFTALFGVPPI